MPTHYAWSPIRAGGMGKDEKNIKRGAKVSAADLGISAEEFDSLVESGAVREKKFPAPDDFEGSAVDWARQQLAEVSPQIDEEKQASALAAVVEAENAG